MKNLIYFIFCLLTISTFMSCDKDTNPDDVSPKTRVLTQSDFDRDLVLEDVSTGVDYIAESVLFVTSALTIRPGVTIQFKEGAGLSIVESGSIEARGTSDKKITFTSQIKAKGAWVGIIVQSVSLRNVFEHCIIEYGGGDTWGNDTQGGISTWARAALNIDHCTFKSNKSFAVDLYGSINVELRSFDNNVFENNDAPIMIEPHNAPIIGSNNSFADINNYIGIEPIELHKTNRTYLWKALSIPYYINGSLLVQRSNLTLQPGVVIEFGEKGEIRVDDGSLTAVGIPNNGITFTGRIKAPGSWGGISFQFTTSPQNLLEYLTVEYAGGSYDPKYDEGVIYMWASPKVSVKNCTFRNNKVCIFNSNSGGAFDQPNLIEENNIVTGSQKFCQ